MGTVMGRCQYNENNMGLSLLVSLITGTPIPNYPIGMIGIDDALDIIMHCVEGKIKSGRYICVERI